MGSETIMSFKELYEQEKAAADEAKTAYREEHDMKDFIKWEKGTTGFTLVDKVPRDGESFGKTVKIFRIIVDEVEYDWSVNIRSPLYMQLLQCAVDGVWELKLTRTGEGMQTRYELIVPN